MDKTTSPLSRLLAGGLLTLSSLAATAGAHAHERSPFAEVEGLEHAWVQAAAPSGWSIRALTRAAQCPSLRTEQALLPMQERTAPEDIAARVPASGASAPAGMPARFELRSCELAWPAGARQVQLGHYRFKAPAAEPRRLLLIGDSGCRIKGKSIQNCEDGHQWPLEHVLQVAAGKKPDLVIHVGDYHYRETRCTPDQPGCTQGPWGYGDDVWVADFFKPAARLLAQTPWVFARGNHESCARAGLGWFRFLDAAPYDELRSCRDPAQDGLADFSAPYAVPLGGQTQLIVFDSAAASHKSYAPDAPDLQRYRERLQQALRLSRQTAHSVFVSHHPALAYNGKADGSVEPGTQGLQMALNDVFGARLYPPSVDLVINGHVHLFEALGFASDHPATLVVGNTGSATEGWIDPARAGSLAVAPGAQLDTFLTRQSFGFATLDRHGKGWLLTEWSIDGEALDRCEVQGPRLHCGGKQR